MTPRGSVLALFALVACKPPEKPRVPEHDDAPERHSGAPPPAVSTIPTTPPEGFATSDFVTIRLGDLAAYAVKDNKLVRTGVVTLVKLEDNADPDEARFAGRIGDGDFVDADHLFIEIGDRTVVQVTSTSVTKVAVPRVEEMTAPRPPKTDNPDSGPGGHDGRLIATDTEVWWSECAWGFAADGFQCELHVNAELWPKPHIEQDRSAPRPRGFVWPTLGPAGFAIRNLKRDYRDTGVVCEPPKGQGTKTTLSADADENENIVGYAWVSQQPPRLLVIYGHAGYADIIPDRWTLHAGCTQQPLATGTTAEPGPNGLWIANSGDDAAPKLAIYRGGDSLGELPSGTSVLFRPTK